LTVSYFLSSDTGFAETQQLPCDATNIFRNCLSGSHYSVNLQQIYMIAKRMQQFFSKKMKIFLGA